METIINADDFGLSKTVNQAILYCFKKNLIQCTSLMVNMPFADEAVAISKKEGFSHLLGLHINLVEGAPLSSEIKKTRFCDENGLFNGSIMRGKCRLIMSREETIAVKEEIEAQFTKFFDYGCRCHHIDSHRHSHTNYPVLKIILKLAKSLSDCPIRLSCNIPSYRNKGLKGFYKKVINKKIKKFNSSHSKSSISKFGSLNDFEKFEKEDASKEAVVELMIHPIMKKAMLSDAINDKSIEEWLNERQ